MNSLLAHVASSSSPMESMAALNVLLNLFEVLCRVFCWILLLICWTLLVVVVHVVYQVDSKAMNSVSSYLEGI